LKNYIKSCHSKVKIGLPSKGISEKIILSLLLRAFTLKNEENKITLYSVVDTAAKLAVNIKTVSISCQNLNCINFLKYCNLIISTDALKLVFT